MTLALVLIAAALLAVAWTVQRAAALVSRAIGSLGEDLTAVMHGGTPELGQRLGAVEAQILALPRTWEEFRNEAKRAEQRARAIVRDAQKDLGELGLESPALDVQAGELQARHGGGGDEDGLRPLRGEMGGAPAAHQSEDQFAAIRRRKYGA